MTEQHTPTPWQISDMRTIDDTAMIVGGEGFEFGLIADVTEDFDAAFIVKAVNNHDALVKALQFIADGYDNHDVSHMDFRVKAFQVAMDALSGIVERGK